MTATLGTKLEIVPGLEKITKTIGEGPHWDDATQTLLFVDIMSGDAYKWDYKTQKVEKYHTDDGAVSLIVPRKSGGYVISVGQRLMHLDWDTKTTTPLTDAVDDGRKTRLNDGKCDPQGRLWAGSMGLEKAPAQLELEAGSLYRIDTDKKLSQQLDKISISNGLAWTSDNTTMYYIDSIPRVVYGFDYDADTGNISNKRVAVDYVKINEVGVPDGMCIDAEDKLWVANFFGGRIIRVDPQTGKQMLTVTIPGLRTTSCCFGGPNLDELFVTCASTGATEEELKMFPMSGSVFRITGLGVKGCKADVYKG